MKLKIASKKISSTVLISMTDVVFLLIIFLLITSNFTSQTGIPIKLPGSTSSQKQSLQVLHVIYENDDSIVFMEQRFNIYNLAEPLQKVFRNKDQVVRLSAAKETDLQKVINLMDIVRGCGYEKIFIATERPDQANAR
jgi:biopolymer transport protein ExbD